MIAVGITCSAVQNYTCLCEFWAFLFLYTFCVCACLWMYVHVWGCVCVCDTEDMLVSIPGSVPLPLVCHIEKHFNSKLFWFSLPSNWFFKMLLLLLFYHSFL